MDRSCWPHGTHMFTTSGGAAVTWTQQQCMLRVEAASLTIRAATPINAQLFCAVANSVCLRVCKCTDIGCVLLYFSVYRCSQAYCCTAANVLLRLYIRPQRTVNAPHAATLESQQHPVHKINSPPPPQPLSKPSTPSALTCCWYFSLPACFNPQNPKP